MQWIKTWKEKQWAVEQQGSPCGFSRVTAARNRRWLFSHYFRDMRKTLYRCGSERTVSVEWSWKESRLVEYRGLKSYSSLQHWLKFCSSKRVKKNNRLFKEVYFLDHLVLFNDIFPSRIIEFVAQNSVCCSETAGPTLFIVHRFC